MKIEKRIWQHEPLPGKEDHRGQERFCLLHDDGDVLDHFATEAEAYSAFVDEVVKEVNIKLRARVADFRSRASDLEYEAKMLRSGAKKIIALANDGRWWNLAGILSAEQIEVLSTESPDNLLEDLT